MIGQPLAELLEAERVTCAAGVPTIWTLLYQHLKEKTYDLSSLHTILVGGSAASRAMIENFERDFGIRVAARLGHDRDLAAGHRLAAQGGDGRLARGAAARGPAQAGHPDARRRDRGSSASSGEDLPWDGEHVGELVVRGPWVASSYYNNPEAGAAFTADGWFRTGDMASDRPIRLRPDHRPQEGPDQAQGGVDLQRRHGERRARAIRGVLEAAVVGRPDPSLRRAPRRPRRPPRRPATTRSRPQDIIDLLARKFARWQLPLPEDIHFVDVAAQDRRRQDRQEAAPPGAL